MSTLEHHRDSTLDTLGAPFSHLVLDDRYAFVAGVVATDVPGGAEVVGDLGRETEVVLGAIDKILKLAGLDLSSVVRTDVHLSDLSRFDEMNRAYGAFFSEGREPARTCVEVRRLIGGCGVEITCVARR